MRLKIEKIKNVRNLNINESKYDSRVGCIFGLNGSGKTTIKYVVQSLFSDELILEKNFGKKKDSQEVYLYLNKEPYFFDGKWNRKPNTDTNLFIFDNEFVNNNLYIDGKVSTSTRPNLTEVIYGKVNISRYNDTLQIDKKIFDIKEQYKNYVKTIPSLKNIHLLKNLVNSFETIRKITEFKETVCLRTIEKIEDHFKEYINDSSESREWLNKGPKFQKNNKYCPMCGNDLDVSQTELFTFLNNNSIISDSYTTKKRILEIEMSNCLSILSDDSFTYKVKYKKRVISQLEQLLEEKKDDWEKSVFLSEFKLLKNAIDDINNTYNEIVSLPEKITNNYIECSGNIKKIFGNGFSDFKEISILTSSIEGLEKEKNKIKESINVSSKKMFGNKIDIINRDLKLYGIPYELNQSLMYEKLKSKNTSKISTVETPLLFNYIGANKPINVKEAEISKVLSQGEKAVIAWILFKNNILEKVSAGKNVIILDDPISSYDSYKRFALIRTIREFSINKANNVLILSHEKSFIHLYGKQNIGDLYTINETQIVKVDPKRMVNNELVDNLKRILEINKSTISSENIIEFLVRARRLIDFDLLLNEKRELKLENAYENISKILHGQNVYLYKVTIRNIFILINKYTKVQKVIVSIDKNEILKKPIDAVAIATKFNTNLYSYRIIIEYYLRKCAMKTRYRQFVIKSSADNKEVTLGRLFSFVKNENNNKMTKEMQISISYTIPIINMIYHETDIFGMTMNALSQKNLYMVQDVVNSILKLEVPND